MQQEGEGERRGEVPVAYCVKDRVVLRDFACC